MRHRLPLLGLPLIGLSLIAVCVVAAAPAWALDLPPRKVGLWDLKMNFEGRNIPPQAMQQCIDAETDKLMNSIGGNMQKEACSKQDVTKTGDTIVVDSVCKFGTATTTSHGVVSGDFNSAYTVKVTSKREGGPQMPGMPADGSSNMTIEAKWLGACKADQKPGDMIMAGGRKINIRDMQNLQNMMGGVGGGARQMTPPPAPK
jgi:Protein of unknown function (DUF3617)